MDIDLVLIPEPNNRYDPWAMSVWMPRIEAIPQRYYQYNINVDFHLPVLPHNFFCRFESVLLVRN